MKVLGLDHVAIAVKNLDEAVEKLKKVLGVEPHIEEVPEEKVKIAMFDLGNVRIEVLQGTAPDSAVTKFVEKRGEGIHHIAVRVDNIEKATEELKSLGFELVYPEPKVVAGGSRKINFVHPKSVHGVLLELVERV